jgi:hypothetical protein
MMFRPLSSRAMLLFSLMLALGLSACGNAPSGTRSGAGVPLSVSPTDVILTFNGNGTGNCTAGTTLTASYQVNGGFPPYQVFSSAPLITGFSTRTLLNSGDVLAIPVTCPLSMIGFSDLTITDNQGTQVTAKLTVELNPGTAPGALTITNTSPLPAGVVNQPYNVVMNATGGTAPLTWSVQSGNLPPGLTLSPTTGILAGIPTTAGIFSFVISVADAVGQAAFAAFTLDVTGSLSITTASPLPNGVINQFYTQIMTAAGGIPPYTWALNTGILPPGVTIDPATGILSGTPTATGTFNFIIGVTDSVQNQAIKTFALTIDPGAGGGTGPTISTTQLPAATNGIAYSGLLSATGGTQPYTWAIAGGVLPAGLTLAPATGIISGTPNEVPGIYNLVVSVRGAAGLAAFASVSLTLNAGAAPPPATSATQISLGTTQTSVLSDNSNSATITATVLDANFAVVQGAVVQFSATGGQLSASTGVTDVNGQVPVIFSSGTVDPTNQVVTITATVLGVTPTLSAQIPIQIVGSTVTLATNITNLTNVAPGNTATLTVTARNAGGQPVFNTPVTLSLDPLSTGSVNITPATGTTDVNGQLVVTVTGVTAGTATVIASAVGAQATQTYTVSAAGAAFGICDPNTTPPAGPPPCNPVAGPAASAINTPLTVWVNVPATVPPALPILAVRFATTLGSWNGVPGQSVVTIPTPVPGFYSATLTSTLAGIANVQVDGLDAAPPAVGNVLATDQLTVAFSATTASQITLQSSVNVVPPSTGGLTHTATLTATVRDINGQVVANAPVAFSILNPTGGGETVSPVVVLTDATGQAVATFTSGSLSSTPQGVNIQAQVIGTAITAQTNIVIGGTAGSVIISTGTAINTIDPTTYSLPMSVLVSDSNGNPVANTVVSLKAWPLQFSTGVWIDTSGPPPTGAGPFVAVTTGTFNNEDINRNLILDPGEDGGTGYPADGMLTPPNSDAGTLPLTVTTGANGVASFNLVYLKSRAPWIIDEITASTFVFGTETTSQIVFALPFDAQEGNSGVLANAFGGSPYGPGTVPALSITTPSPLPSGAVGVAYTSGPLAATGLAPLTWSVGVGSTLPPGLTLNPGTGEISGIPTTGGLYSFLITVTDALGNSVTKTFVIDILGITTPSPLPAGTVAVAYPLTTFTAIGGTVPYTWAQVGGTLPPGLTFVGGVLSGTPTAAGVYNFTVSVQDSSVPPLTTTKSFSLTIN